MFPLNKKIKKIIENIPKLPGIYIMKGSRSEILYIGKAKILKNRIYSYFQNSRILHPRTKIFLKKVDDIKFLTTKTEAEALILESNFIKKHQPRYNVLLKDDKHYPYLRLTTQEKFPRLEVVRRVRKDKAVYFGPYTMVKEVRETIRLIYKIFPLRQSKDKLSGQPMRRPCLNHQMGRCLAPCAGKISYEHYRIVVEDVELFLKGKNMSLLKKLKAGMESSASELRFEEAAVFRDKIQAVQTVLDKQKIISTSLKDQDVIAYCSEKDKAIAQVLIIRDGKMLSEKIFKMKSLNEMKKNETLSSFLKQYYAEEVVLPAEILLPHSIEDFVLIADWLSEKKGMRVKLEIPITGKKRDLVKMAEENARFAMRMEHDKGNVGTRSLEELQAALSLAHFPEVIEGFDLSNISGSHAVGSMVTFENGLADKSKYRRYKITTVKGVDDYAMLREVMTRRYRHLLDENCPLPNLVIIDGGRGHLSSGRAVLKALGILDQIDLACIAKGKYRNNLDTDEVYLANRKEPVLFNESSPSRFLMQRIRDEAHRFAISYHRKLRRKETLSSPLEKIPGIGKKRRLLLLKEFGSLENIRNTSVEELTAMPGITISIAKKLRYHESGSD
jgi:excinuclease ABC subunit C